MRLQTNQIVFAFRKDSPFVKIMSVHIRRVSHLISSERQLQILDMKRTSCGSEDELSSLKLTKLISLFVLLSVGEIISLMVLMFEAIFKKLQSKDHCCTQPNNQLVTIMVGKSKIRIDEKSWEKKKKMLFGKIQKRRIFKAIWLDSSLVRMLNFSKVILIFKIGTYSSFTHNY